MAIKSKTPAKSFSQPSHFFSLSLLLDSMVIRFCDGGGLIYLSAHVAAAVAAVALGAGAPHDDMAAVAYICPVNRDLPAARFHFSPTQKSDPRAFGRLWRSVLVF